jgi:plastocyanin
VSRVLLLLAVLVLAGCGSEEGDDDSASAGERVQITAKDFELDPADVRVEASGETTFTLSNEGESEHALEVEGNGVEEETETIAPGDTASVTVDLEPGEYELYCPVDDHRSRGMEATLVVGGGSGGAGTTTGETEPEEDDGYGG